jgi:hypothetical protein
VVLPAPGAADSTTQGEALTAAHRAGSTASIGKVLCDGIMGGAVFSSAGIIGDSAADCDSWCCFANRLDCTHSIFPEYLQ